LPVKAPLFFTFRESIACEGFKATVVAAGRLLARFEEGGVWLDGVNPGAIAEGGATLPEAIGAFRATFREVIEDLATANRESFDSFVQAATGWFDYCDEASMAEWWNAVETVRAAFPNKDEIPMKVKDADTAVTISIERDTSEQEPMLERTGGTLIRHRLAEETSELPALAMPKAA
jgi:hypothetical protein